MAGVEIYFPKRKESVTISGADLLPREGQSKSEFLNKKMEIERQLDKHERGLFSRKMKVPGLKCSQCSWLQFTEGTLAFGEEQPRCWLYNAPRMIFGKSESERQVSFDSLECVGEKDMDMLANRLMRVPAFIKGKPVRKDWFKKNFPKGFKALSKQQKALLSMKGGKLYTDEELKSMGEDERKVAEQKVEEDIKKRKKKFKVLVARIPMGEKVALRADLIDKVAKKRLVVLRKIEAQIKIYSGQYQKWSGKTFYGKLLEMISSDLAQLSDYYLAAKTVRHFRDVSDLYRLLGENVTRLSETTKIKPPLKVVGTPQMQFYAPLVGLGVFDYSDFTKNSVVRLKQYMKKKGIKATKKLPTRLSEIVNKEWVSVTKYKKWRKDQPKISTEFLSALNAPVEKLLKQVRLDKSGNLVVDDLPLEKRLAILNAVYVNYARIFDEKVRQRLLEEKFNFDKKYLSGTSDIVGATVKVPLSKSEMVVLNKKNEKIVLDMSGLKLHSYRMQIEEDVRYSAKYKAYVDEVINDLSILDREFVKLKIDPVMDTDPRTGIKYKELTPSQKMKAWEEAKKAVKELDAKFKKFGFEKDSRVRYGDEPKAVKRLDKMTFNEKTKALSRIVDRRARKKAEKLKLKEARKKKVILPKEEATVTEKVVRSVRDEIEGTRSNIKVVISYDISGSILDVWEIESKMMGRDKKWHVFTPTRKREIKRRRKIIKNLLSKISNIEGIDMIVMEPDEKDISFLTFMGFKPIKKSIRKEIMAKSAFTPVNIERMKLYMG